jgi:SAM-dependent methyltransferase
VGAVRELLPRVLPRRPVSFGGLRRTTPVSRHFGYDRGTPVDRRYIEEFLSRNAADVRGRVLEVGDDTYTRAFGGDRVSRRDVLHVDPSAPNVTYVADLAAGDGLPSDAFDCIVLTQTLHLVFDMPAAVATLHRILKPGGVVLVTVPGVSSVDAGEWGDAWLWSLTPASLGRLMRLSFAPDDVAIASYGNVLTAIAFLHGFAAEELHADEIAARDPQYPVIVAARARKAS